MRPVSQNWESLIRVAENADTPKDAFLIGLILPGGQSQKRFPKSSKWGEKQDFHVPVVLA
jgi:hypothetical protein